VASIVFTWLYNSTRSSLLMVILFHGLFDLLSVSRAGGDNVAAIMSAGVMIWAVLVVILFKSQLTTLPRIPAHRGVGQL
jgi:membrane protease YdiL (CAAX protease family)